MFKKVTKKLVKIQEDVGIGAMSGAGAPIAQMGGVTPQIKEKKILEEQEPILQEEIPQPVLNQVQDNLASKLNNLKQTFNRPLEESVIQTKLRHFGKENLIDNPKEIDNNPNSNPARATNRDEYKSGITGGLDGAKSLINVQKKAMIGDPITESESNFGHVSKAHQNINKETQAEKDNKIKVENNKIKAANQSSNRDIAKPGPTRNPLPGHITNTVKQLSDEQIQRRLKYRE